MANIGQCKAVDAIITRKNIKWLNLLKYGAFYCHKCFICFYCVSISIECVRELNNGVILHSVSIAMRWESMKVKYQMSCLKL